MDRVPEAPTRFPAVLCQRDPRWAARHLGYPDAASGSTIGLYGCAITSLAMLLTYYGSPCTPERVQDELLEGRGYRNTPTRNLVDWPQLAAIYPQIKSITRSDFLSRDPNAREMAALNAELSSGKPAILKVDGVPGGELDEHFVLAYGVLESGIMVADPYSGAVKPVTDFCPTNKPWRKTEAAAIWAILYFEMRLT